MSDEPTTRTALKESTADASRRRPRERGKAILMGLLLFAIAVVGPAVAYAGISVVWPTSDQSVDIDSSPPITFVQGTDHTQAASIGFASGFTTSDNGAAFDITLSGLSGGTVIIDDYVNVTAESSVDTYKMQVSSALAGTLSTPSVLKLRLWTGSTAPTADGDAQVCAVLDLTAAADTETSSSCSDDAKVQLTYTLPSSSSGSSTVSIRPSSITFA